MKFLDLASLRELNTLLSCFDCGGSVILGRLEAYSCKRAGSDKKLYKTLNNSFSVSAPDDDAAEFDVIEGVRSPTSPTGTFGQGLARRNSISSSPFGPLSDTQNRRTYISLIQALNAAWVDYDFSSLAPEDFSKNELKDVMNTINHHLATTPSPEILSIISKIWQTLEAELKLSETVVYSFNPNQRDPFGDQHALWHFHYFFFNKKLKRVIYFTSKSISKAALQSTMNDESPDEVGDWYYDQAVYNEVGSDFDDGMKE